MNKTAILKEITKLENHYPPDNLIKSVLYSSQLII